MTWLVEDPWTVLLVCIAIGVAVQIVCSQISQHAMLMGFIGLAIFTAIMLGIEYFVVTDRESVENSVLGAADAVASGDLDRVDLFLVSRNNEVRNQARTWMNHFKVRRVKCTDLKITTNRYTVPPTAHVELWAVVELEPSAASGGMAGPFRRQVKLDLEWENNYWRIATADVVRE